MRNLLTFLATAFLVFAGLTAAGFAASPFLLPPPPNTYRTSIYDITLPPGWTCAVEVSESVCRPDGPPPHRAILIAAMKIRNPKMDSLDTYAAHVGKPITGVDADGQAMTSKVEDVERVKIDGRIWVDATHLGSEIRGYKTRYLATVTVNVAVLITFSVHEKDFEAYQPAFEKAVRSLNIYQRYNSSAET